jgi:hypothetical protein
VSSPTAPAALPPPSPLPKEAPRTSTTASYRGRAAMLKDAPSAGCACASPGRHVLVRERQGHPGEQSTVTNPDGSGKPPHRIRNRYDFLGPIIDAKVSAATQRVPVLRDQPEHGGSAPARHRRSGEKVALYGYDKWRLREGTLKTVDLAIGGGGVGYAMPVLRSGRRPVHPGGGQVDRPR